MARLESILPLVRGDAPVIAAILLVLFAGLLL
jgi:hypothetical protein